MTVHNPCQKYVRFALASALQRVDAQRLTASPSFCDDQSPIIAPTTFIHTRALKTLNQIVNSRGYRAS